MLGLHRKQDPEEDKMSLVQARMKHARGEGPKPEAKTPDPGRMGALIGRGGAR